MEIYSGDLNSMVKEINEKAHEYMGEGLKVGIIASDETIDDYDLYYTSKNIISMGSRWKLESIATNIFNVLRKFDKLNVDIILSEGVEEVKIGKAIMNRMKKAAGGNITYLK